MLNIKDDNVLTFSPVKLHQGSLREAVEISSAMFMFKGMSEKEEEVGVQVEFKAEDHAGHCLGVQAGAVGHEVWGKGRGCVMASVCPSGSAMGPLGDLGQEASLQPPHPTRITVPFKATQHLFPPIKTNNLFCRKSRQLLSAGAEAWLDGL